jgi:hypothetical protein
MKVSSKQAHKKWRRWARSLGTQPRCTTTIGTIAQLMPRGLAASWSGAPAGRAHALTRRQGGRVL